MTKPEKPYREFLRDHAEYELFRFNRVEQLVEAGIPRDVAVKAVFPDHPEYLEEGES